jgi:hypothetical protein
MMRPLLIVLSLLVPVLVAAQVYKWVDADGKVHYSDRPITGAEPLPVPLKKVPQPQATPAAPIPASPGPYAQFEVLTPEPNATLRDAEGNLTVGLVLEPPLMAGHRLQLLLDGGPVTGEAPGTQLLIKGLPFGSHDIQAQILGAGGALIATSSTIRFHLRKPDTP